MRNRIRLIHLLCAFAPMLTAPPSYAKSIRTIEADDGSVIFVKTALGYSTILEFSSKPLSAVLGDQDAFKLEYVGNQVTIKPLMSHAKSNLFVFTEYGRFNCELQTGAADLVDYIIRIKEKPYQLEKGLTTAAAARRNKNVEPGTWTATQLSRSVSYDGFKLIVHQLNRERGPPSPRAVTLIDFELLSSRKAYSFQAASVGVKQHGNYLVLESLFLDSLQLVPNAPGIHGKIALLSQDFESGQPVTLVFAVPDTHDPKSIHRIEVTTSAPLKKVVKPKKGGEPWDQPQEAPKPNSASLNTSLPTPTPSVSAAPLELEGWRLAPSFL